MCLQYVLLITTGPYAFALLLGIINTGENLACLPIRKANIWVLCMIMPSIMLAGAALFMGSIPLTPAVLEKSHDMFECLEVTNKCLLFVFWFLGLWIWYFCARSSQQPPVDGRVLVEGLAFDGIDAAAVDDGAPVERDLTRTGPPVDACVGAHGGPGQCQKVTTTDVPSR